jgi:hypothetical protein
MVFRHPGRVAARERRNGLRRRGDASPTKSAPPVPDRTCPQATMLPYGPPLCSPTERTHRLPMGPVRRGQPSIGGSARHTEYRRASMSLLQRVDRSGRLGHRCNEGAAANVWACAGVAPESMLVDGASAESDGCMGVAPVGRSAAAKLGVSPLWDIGQTPYWSPQIRAPLDAASDNRPELGRRRTVHAVLRPAPLSSSPVLLDRVLVRNHRDLVGGLLTVRRDGS